MPKPIEVPTPLRTPDGRTLDLYLAGPSDAEVLVFHTGTPTASIPFDPLVRALADRGLRYVAASRPGYGSSTRQAGRSVADVADDVRTILDHLGAERAWVAGWSGGGPHALACAALLPDRVRAVATIGSVAPFSAEDFDWLAGMGAENIEEFGAALDGPERLSAFMEASLPALRSMTGQDVATGLGDLIDDVDRAALTGAFAEWNAAIFRESVRESIWGWFDDDMAMVKPWGFDLDSIKAPVHVWQGGHDRMVPFAHGAWLATHIPTAVPHLLEAHGHLSLWVDSIGDILDELIASRP